MTRAEIERLVYENANSVKNRLSALIGGRHYCEDLVEAMEYTCLGNGKYVRSFLVNGFCRACLGKEEDSLDFAAAVEMIHAYSLIHDDLPCMDNDDMRRGKPSSHKVFGEAVALLAGDGLLTRAFEVVANAKLPDNSIVKAVSALSRYAGPDGMVGGQMLDLADINQNSVLYTLERIYEGKTCGLFKASCLLGVYASGGGEREENAALEYGRALGMAFQIIDDILDVTGDLETIGKKPGSDVSNGKTTVCTLFGVEKAKEIAADYCAIAESCASEFNDGGVLLAFAQYLLDRTK